MKKISYILISVFVFYLVIFSGLIMSCELETDAQEAVVKEPGVEKIEGERGIAISVYNVSDTEYVNIYRQDVTNEDKPGPIVNIGLIFPEQYHDHGWLYQDYYIYSNKEYRYCVKYTTTDGVYKSGWSEGLSVDSAYDEDTVKFKYTVPKESYFEYDEENYIITLKGNNIIADAIPSEILTNAKACIVVSTNTNKKTYPFHNINPEQLEINVVQMHLRSILEPEFTNTPITIDGIILEKEFAGDKSNDDDEDEIVKPKSVAWGIISDAIPLKNLAGKSVKTITIKSTTADGGFDFSD